MSKDRWVPAGVAFAPDCEIDPILVAAAELFERDGYVEARVLDIARKSCVSMNTQFRRYPHKRDLLAGIVKAFADNFAVHLGGLTERRRDPEVERVCAKVGAGGGEVGY